MRLSPSVVARLAECFPTVKELVAAGLDSLIGCILGREVARSVHRHFRSPEARREVEELERLGVRTSHQQARIEPSEWTGKRLVITGSFEAFDRETLSQRLTQLGAHVTGSVSKNTDILLKGDKPGSKLDKAIELGVDVWDEAELLKHLKPA